MAGLTTHSIFRWASFAATNIIRKENPLSPEIAVVAIAQVKPGQENAAEHAIRPCVAPTRKEDGCHLYTIHTDLDQTGRFVFIERWASRAALDAHMQTPHFLAMAKALESLLAKPFEVFITRELAD